MKYCEWLNEWQVNYVSPTLKTRTAIRYKGIIANHLVKELGTYEMEDLQAIMLQRYTVSLLKSGNSKTGRGLSANSVNAIITVIQSSLKTAYDIGLTSNYVAKRIRRPKAEEHSVLCFTQSEQNKIEKAALSSKKPKMFGIVLCLYTGLRIGELLALKWSDVDLKNGVVVIDKTRYDCKAGAKFTQFTDTPKTTSSIRNIPIPRQLLPKLKALKNMRLSDYVVSDGEKPLFVRSYQRSFELLLKKINVEKKGFHALRHTFATRAIECGMDVKTLSEILGHKNSVITLNRYVHSMYEHKKNMMNKLGKRLE